MNNFVEKLDKKHVKLLGILLIFLFIVLLVLNALYRIRNNAIKNDMINSVIDGTNWPIEEVPVLLKDGVSVSGDLKNIFNVRCENEVTYDELRNYLIELYNSGFKPVTEFGCQNPNTLKTSIDNVNLKELLWIAEKGNYTVNILWAQKGATNELGNVYDYNFEMTLFVNSNNYEYIPDDDVSSGDVSMSGDSSFNEIISGEVE